MFKNKKSVNYFDIFILSTTQGIGGALATLWFSNNLLNTALLCGIFGVLGLLILEIKTKLFEFGNSRTRKMENLKNTAMLINICYFIFIGMGCLFAIISYLSFVDGKEYYIFPLLLYLFFGICSGVILAIIIEEILADMWNLTENKFEWDSNARKSVLPSIVIVSLIVSIFVYYGFHLSNLLLWLYLSLAMIMGFRS